MIASWSIFLESKRERAGASGDSAEKRPNRFKKLPVHQAYKEANEAPPVVRQMIEVSLHQCMTIDRHRQKVFRELQFNAETKAAMEDYDKTRLKGGEWSLAITERDLNLYRALPGAPDVACVSEECGVSRHMNISPMECTNPIVAFGRIASACRIREFRNCFKPPDVQAVVSDQTKTSLVDAAVEADLQELAKDSQAGADHLSLGLHTTACSLPQSWRNCRRGSYSPPTQDHQKHFRA